MVWIKFLISAAVISLAAMQLAKYGDIIGIRTKLGGMFVGTLLMATATSLPEVLTTINAVLSGVPDLAAGNLFGSNMFNMLLLAVLDLVHHRRRITRKDATKHALSGSLALTMIALAIFFIIAQLDVKLKIGSFAVGVDGLFMILFYFIAMSLLRKQSSQMMSAQIAAEIPEDLPSLKRSIIWFSAAALVLIFVTPVMVDSSAEIARITGLGATFIGATLVAIVTSLPEMVTTIAAGRIGADDMAIGNLYGSNMFNMFSIGIADLFLLNGRFFGAIDSSFLLVGMLGLVMTAFALIGNLARIEKKFLFIEIDAFVLILVYFGGMVLLYFRGLTP